MSGKGRFDDLLALSAIVDAMAVPPEVLASVPEALRATARRIVDRTVATTVVQADEDEDEVFVGMFLAFSNTPVPMMAAMVAEMSLRLAQKASADA